MSMHMNLIRKSIDDGVIRAAGEAMGKAVVVTGDELIVGKCGMFGRWGGRLERFNLGELQHLYTTPNPSANLLSLEFGGRPGAHVTLMYTLDAQADFEGVIRLLRARLDGGEKAGR